MSQMTATARAGLRAQGLVRGQAAPRLHVVTGREARQGSAGFVLLCTALLVATMLTLLVLNTSRAEASFRIGDLQATSGRLADAESGLRAELAYQSSPARLATRARAQGMVPSQTAAFIRTSDGAILGVAKKAEAQPDFRVVEDAAPREAATTTGQEAERSAVTAAGRGAGIALQDGTAKESAGAQDKSSTGARGADRKGADTNAPKSTKDSSATTKR